MSPGGLRATLLALCLGAALPACGYRLAGSNTFLPERIRVIAVDPFENRTTRPEIDQRVTEEVARELSERGPYKIQEDRGVADALLQGAITSYRTRPVQFDADGRAERVEALVMIDATLRDLSNDQLLWSQRGLVFRGQFEVPETSDFSDRESEAINQVARDAAAALITSILEGF
jgi:outer membrane lipopolysaccharide assembly protein LptE/RlpB